MEAYRLSRQQRRAWALEQDNPNYRAQCAMVLEGPLDRVLLKQSFAEVVARHEILRTVFLVQPGVRFPFQGVDGNRAPLWHELDWTRENGWPSQLESLLEQERTRLFDLVNGPVLHIVLVGISLQTHLLILTLPSLCADSRSLETIIRDLSECYAEGASHTEPVPEPLQYVDFAEWEDELLEEVDDAAGMGKSYWERVGGLSAVPAKVPFAAPASRQAAFQPRWVRAPIDPALVTEIEAFAAENGGSVEAFLLACWQTLLWRLNRQECVVVGVVSDGRTHEELKDTAGPISQCLPAATQFRADLPLKRICERVVQTLEDVREWQSYFTTGQACAAAFEFRAWPESVRAGRLSFRHHTQYSHIQHFTLKLQCNSTQSSLTGDLHYDASLLDQTHAEFLARAFAALVKSALVAPASRVSALHLLSSDDEECLLRQCQSPPVAYPAGMRLYDLVESQAAQTPDRVALVCGENHLTYADIDARADRLAHRLRESSVGPDDRVALLGDRSAEILIGALGVLKSGAAYVPLDPDQPRPRIQHMLSETGASVVISGDGLRPPLPEFAGRVIGTDDIASPLAGERPVFTSYATSRNLAYVIYTSGSTGTPKGVAVTHESLVNYACALRDKLYDGSSSPSAGMHFATVSTFTADLGNTGIFIALVSGGCLHIVDPAVTLDPDGFAEYLSRHSIDVVKMVPSHFSALADSDDPERFLPNRHLILGGEGLPIQLVERIRRARRSCRLMNHYGPTEAAIGSTTLELDAPGELPGDGLCPIGRPIANTGVYVADPDLELLPDGVAGELYIGGDSLARGYIQRPDLTAEAFVPDPFGASGARLYRTGDLGLRLPDGAIQFLGRSDQQVKIRGFRIELGEIETALRQHPRVRDAVVVSRSPEPGNRGTGTPGTQLAAYVVSAAGTAPSATELRRFTEERVPDHMVPGFFVALDALPVTSNGKVDRGALARRPATAPQGDAGFAEPRTPLEEMLVHMWRDVLGVEKIGIHDDFFRLGGHSLLATQLISRARKALAVEFPIQRLFEAPTVAGMAGTLDAMRQPADTPGPPPLSRYPREGNIPLSFAQQRLWFLDQLMPGSSLYNVQHALRLHGTLDVAALRRAQNEIIRRHEILRTTFHLRGDQPVQVIGEAMDRGIPIIDLEAVEELEREEEVSRQTREMTAQPFDLDTGPLLRTRLLRLGEKEHVWVIIAHHIVLDGWSMDIFVREFTQLYAAFSAGRASPLGDLPVQYADFAIWQREWLEGPRAEPHLSYWRRQLQGVPDTLNLPIDKPRPARQTFKGALQTTAISPNLSKELAAFSQREGVSLFMTLLAAFQTLLHRYTGQDDILIGSAIANRNRAEIEGLIGFFVNIIGLRTNFSGDPGFRELLSQVRKTTLEAYAHQDLPAEKIVEHLAPHRDISRTPMVQVGFTLQNAPLSDIELPGLEVGYSRIDPETAKTDLSLFVQEDPAGLAVLCEYSTDLFERSTIEDLLENFLALLETVVVEPERPLSTLPPFAVRGRSDGSWESHYDRANLTKNQLLIWLAQRLLPEQPVFNLAAALRVHGPVEAAVFRSAFQSLVDGTDTLRTTLDEIDGLPRARVADALAYPVPCLDFSTAQDPSRDAEDWINEHARQPFALDERAFDSALLKVSEHEHIWYLNQHHTLTDGWSLWLIYNRMTSLYNAIRSGETVTGPRPPSFQDYVAFERNFRNSPAHREAELYWTTRLSDPPAPLEFYGKTPRGHAAPVREVSCPLGPERSRRLRLVGRTANGPAGPLRPPELLFTALYGHLYLMTGIPRLTVGHMHHNRPDAFVETAGLFMQILPVRVDIEHDETFASLAVKLKQSLEESVRHGQYAVSNPVQNRAYDVVVNYLGMAGPTERGLGGAPVELEVIHSGSALESLCLRVAQAPLSGDFIAEFDLRADVFDEDDARRTTEHYLRVLDALLADPGKRLDATELLSEGEREQLVTGFNDTGREVAWDETFMERFGGVVRSTPDRVAVRCGDSVVTYAALDARAGRLAGHLGQQGVGAESMVALYLDRSIDMLAAILGVWKAGAAYVPLDPRYPAERVRFMLADAGVEVLITQGSLLNSDSFPAIDTGTCRVLLIDGDWERTARQNGIGPAGASPDNLAYSIYTSGSTGRPKGVMVHHRGMYNHLLAKVHDLALSDTDVVAQTASACFDISVWQFMAALLTGGSVRIYPDETALDPLVLADEIQSHAITIFEAVPSLLNTMLREAPRLGQLSGLRYLLVTGEALPPELARLALRCHPTVPLVNAYGPTECSDDVTHFFMSTPPAESATSVPIGRALANTRLFILHRGGYLAPLGTAGELYVGGLGVGRGYANDPEQTAQAFLPDPFSSQPGQRLYRTGDRARYRPDGAIDFLGRVDHQVKIRGFRIEPGEIEAVLGACPGIREAAVTVRRDGNGQDRLVAYVVPRFADVSSGTRALEWQSEHAGQWQTLWEDTYAAGSPPDDPTFNTVGWNSSYTHQPITGPEMKEWVAHTVERILARRPRRVLELGCGTGLLLTRIASHCTDYWGTDFSRRALDDTQRLLKGAGGELDHVRLLHQAADDFKDIPQGFFDAVVLNSVVQYFPGVEYLVRVLEGAVQALGPGGFVYLGDLRSLPLFEHFHTSVQVHQAEPSLAKEELRHRVDQQMTRDEELLIDPEFFHALRSHLTRITAVEIRLKRGVYHNELTKFRYDVLLHVEREIELLDPPRWHRWGDGVSSLEELRAMIDEEGPDLLGIASIPNARLTADIRALEWLSDGAPGTVGEWRRSLEESGAGGDVDPEDGWGLAEQAGYAPLTTWSAHGGAGEYDLVLKRIADRDSPTEHPAPTPMVLLRVTGEPAGSWREYANDPLQAKFNLGIVPRLREFLQARLPEYMVPSAFLMLDALPLTPNGKVDTGALPEPDALHAKSLRPFVAPRTPVEEAVAKIWAEVLGVDRVSVQDDFFELGGHSLLAVQVISRVRSQFEIEIPLRHLFEATTVAGLAELVERIEWGSRVGEPVAGEEMDEGEI